MKKLLLFIAITSVLIINSNRTVMADEVVNLEVKTDVFRDIQKCPSCGKNSNMVERYTLSVSTSLPTYSWTSEFCLDCQRTYDDGFESDYDAWCKLVGINY